MKQPTTIFLKLALFLIVIPILGFFIIVLPRVMTGLSEVFPVSAYLRYPGLIALYLAIIPFLIALYQTIKLFINFSKNKALSQVSAKTLKNIKYSAITISILYVISMPLLFLMGDADDAPGIILFALIIILVTVVSAVFAAVYEKRCPGNKIS
jgi:hypothetical protein